MAPLSKELVSFFYRINILESISTIVGEKFIQISRNKILNTPVKF